MELPLARRTRMDGLMSLNEEVFVLKRYKYLYYKFDYIAYFWDIIGAWTDFCATKGIPLQNAATND